MHNFKNIKDTFIKMWGTIEKSWNNMCLKFHLIWCIHLKDILKIQKANLCKKMVEKCKANLKGFTIILLKKIQNVFYAKLSEFLFGGN